VTRIASRREFIRDAAVAGAAISFGHLVGCRGLDDRGAALRKLDDASEASLRDFRGAFRGTVIQPDDATFEQARQVYNARFDRHPGLIARPADADDVATAIQFARSEGLLTAVRGGGHSYAGHSTCDGGLMIDLSHMKGLQIDPESAVVRVQSGFTTTELDHAADEAGLVVVLADTPSVGISGLILGGGLCWLNGALGTASDNLVSARVVLADGRVVTASAEEKPDLFWALRGGGGNFGIVTDFTIRAHRLPLVVGGMLVFDLGQAPDVLKAWREAVSSAPDELQTGAQFFARPDFPGGAMMGIRVCYAGSPESAERWIRSLRALGKPVADTITPKTYLAFQATNPEAPVGWSNSIRAGFIRDFDDALIEALPALTADGPAIWQFGMLHWHGAACRMPVEATAFPHREPGLSFLATALWQDPAEAQASIEWVERGWSIVAPHTHGVYVNLLEDEGQERVLAAYEDNYARLLAIKQKYDPDNLFRLNQNIRPIS